MIVNSCILSCAKKQIVSSCYYKQCYVRFKSIKNISLLWSEDKIELIYVITRNCKSHKTDVPLR